MALTRLSREENRFLLNGSKSEPNVRNDLHSSPRDGHLDHNKKLSCYTFFFSFQPIQLSSLTVLNHSDVSKFELFILSQRAATDEISSADSLPQLERKWKIKKISMFNELVKWRDERGTALTHCRPHGEDFGLLP